MLLKIVKLLGLLLGIILLLLILLVLFYLPGSIKIDKQHSLPFEFKREVILLEAYLNEAGPYNFILDTGTDPSVVDIDLADKLALFQLPLGKQEVGEDQAIEIKVPTPLKIQLSDMPASRKLFLGLDLSAFSDKMEMPIHGILGHNFLRDNAFQIDYKKQKIHFYPSEHEFYPEKEEDVLALDLSFIEEDSFPLIDEVSINGKKLRISLDTGYNKSLTLYQAAIKELQLEGKLKDIAGKTSLGYGGEKKIKGLEVSSLRLGNWELTQKSQIFADTESKKSQVAMEIRAGNMGNGILKQFKLSMDYKRKKVWFEKY